MKISVIIPVYNAEDHLEECIQSVLNQNFPDFELLLINDGSTDNSGAICDKYSAKDKRVKVFHQENEGVSTARNLGIEKAIGEWITFIDSDDYIFENYFNPIKEYSDQDLILVNLNIEKESEEEKVLSFENQKYELNEFLKRYHLYPHFPGPCGKFFKTSIIKNNQLRFNKKMDFGEDALFNLQYIFKCNKIASTNSSTYFYRYTPDGLSKKKDDIVEDERYFYEQILFVLEANTNDSQIISQHLHFPLKRYLFSLLQSDLSKKEKRIVVKSLIKKHKGLLIKLLKGHRIHLVPLPPFIRFEWVHIFVLLFRSNK